MEWHVYNVVLLINISVGLGELFYTVLTKRTGRHAHRYAYRHTYAHTCTYTYAHSHSATYTVGRFGASLEKVWPTFAFF